MGQRIGVCLLSAILLAGCAADPATAPDTDRSQPTLPATSARASSAPADPPPRGTVVMTADSPFGVILFDDTGQAIYLFDKEEGTQPECYDECAEAWPPVITAGPPVALADVRADALGTTARADGSTQVTYAGHPLYYYAHEGKNEVLCHNVREFGGLWLALTPSGAAAAH